MYRPNPMPPKCRIEQLFYVDFKLGHLVNKPRNPEDFSIPKRGTRKSCATMWNKQHAGRVVGVGTNTNRYLSVRIDGVSYAVHRLIWFCATGVEPEFIDHINGIRNDNRLENLRAVSHLENCKNIAVTDRNTSGCIGVFWHKGEQKWAAKISNAGQRVYLGYYENFEDAVTARKQAEIKYGYHKNHGEVRPKIGASTVKWVRR